MVEPHAPSSRRVGWRLALKVGAGLWVGNAVLIAVRRVGGRPLPTPSDLHAVRGLSPPTWAELLHLGVTLAILAAVAAPVVVGGLRLRRGEALWPTLRDAGLATLGVPAALFVLRCMFSFWGRSLLGVTAFQSDLAIRAASAPAFLAVMALAALGPLRLFDRERMMGAAPAIVLGAMAAGAAVTLSSVAWALSSPYAQALAATFAPLGMRLVLLAGSRPGWGEAARGAAGWFCALVAAVGAGDYALSFQRHDEFGLTPVLMGAIFPVVAPALVGLLWLAWRLTARRR